MIKEIKKVEVEHFREFDYRGKLGPKQYHGKVILILSDGIEQVLFTQPWMNKAGAEGDTQNFVKMLESLITTGVSS